MRASAGGTPECLQALEAPPQTRRQVDGPRLWSAWIHERSVGNKNVKDYSQGELSRALKELSNVSSDVRKSTAAKAAAKDA